MNLKKIILIITLPLLFSINSNSMQSQRPRENTTFDKILKSAKNSTALCINIIDYLVQLRSINFITSDNEQSIDHFAKARAIVNTASIGYYLSLLYKARLTPFNLSKILGLIDSSIRGYNMHRDYNISKNSKLIAYKNCENIETTKSNNKQTLHYLWLTINKFLPLFVYKFGNLNLYNISGVLTNFSELYRQKLMYSLIENK